MAITVTSVTNVLAFGVGAATILPGLQVKHISRLTFEAREVTYSTVSQTA